MRRLFGGDFVTFAKEATPLGYFKAINNRLVDGAEVGTTDEAQALGNDYPYGIISDAYDPVIWAGNEPPEHKAYVEHLKAFTKTEYASGWSIVGYEAIYALADGIKKAGNTKSDDVAKAMLGLTFDTPVGKRTFSVKSHETFAPEYWGVMVKEAAYPFAVIKDPETAAGLVPDELTTARRQSASPAIPASTAGDARSWGIDRRWRARFCSASSWAASPPRCSCS